MSRTEKFAAGLAKEKRLAQLLIELEWDQADHNLAESLLGTSGATREIVERQQLTFANRRLARRFRSAQEYVHQDSR